MHSPEMVTFVRYCTASNMRIELCYQCFGDPCSKMPVVLLIGGLNMQMYAWDEAFCEELVKSGFFVVRFDNRDIGHSTKIEERGSVVPARLLLPQALAFGERLPYTIADMARDALALLDALGVSFAHIMGISMGGMIAQTVALLAPHRVLSLTSIMSTTNASDLPDPQLWVKMWLLRKPPANCTLEELLNFRVASLKKLLAGTLPVDEEYLKHRYLISLRRSAYSAGLLRQAAAIRRCPGRDEALRSLSCPTLVIHGQQDVLMPPAHGHRTASVIPCAKLIILESMGHYLHPAFFSPIIAHFVEVANTPQENGGPRSRIGLDLPYCVPLLLGVPVEEKHGAHPVECHLGTAGALQSSHPPPTGTATAKSSDTQDATHAASKPGEESSDLIEMVCADADEIVLEEVRQNILEEQLAEASLLNTPENSVCESAR
ncbi:hydrolase-like protein [Trypanosoma conorhini]|uniref:Hydrolase-like protein n=1 Tax=Trypanosoma conorhini TaxID=83891 RepID=A0A422PXR6_9TRYP|nr:hydrolase-like protein [Trypanosoma conorhini]RNF22571.1 hydrolase-like protein [Trypanosoma conorhini]